MDAGRLLDRFSRRAEREGLAVDAAQIWQDGRLLAEKRWKPDIPHVIFSQTKSFVCSAVGMAVSDGVLSLNDTLADRFPEYVTGQNLEKLSGITLNHLLKMTSGFGEGLLMSAQRRSGAAGDDYFRFVLEHPLRFQPGTRFCYSNGDTYLAGRMLEKAAGEPLRQYLERRLLGPMDIECRKWDESPEGFFFSATGMMLRTSDMAKLGLLYLRNGQWNGEQLLDPEWIRRCVSVKQETGKSDPWDRLYGYQLWHMGHIPGAYRFDGACGQYSILVPALSALVVTNCSVESVAALRKAIDEEILLQPDFGLPESAPQK